MTSDEQPANINLDHVKNHHQALMNFLHGWCREQDRILQELIHSAKNAPTTWDSETPMIHHSQVTPNGSEFTDKDGQFRVVPSRDLQRLDKPDTNTDSVSNVSNSSGSDTFNRIRTSSMLTLKMMRKRSSMFFGKQARWQLQDIVSSQWFESMCCMCILVNSAILAMSALCCTAFVQSEKTRTGNA